MKGRMLVIAVLAVCAVGAVRQWTGDPSPLETLMEVPTSAEGAGPAGVTVVDPGPSLGEARQPGRITVLALSSDDCPGCVYLKRRLNTFTDLRPDVAIRIIDLGPQWNVADCERRYGVKMRSIPHVLIYDAEGNLLAADDDRDKKGLELLYDWMNAEQGNIEQGNIEPMNTE